MLLKIIATLLILVAVFMGVKQGYAMFSGKAEMVGMFGKWDYRRCDHLNLETGERTSLMPECFA